MITKRLGIVAPLWRSLPWHDQRMYRELLAEELELEAQQDGEQTSRVSAGGDLGSMGFNVQQAGQ